MPVAVTLSSMGAPTFTVTGAGGVTIAGRAVVTVTVTVSLVAEPWEFVATTR